jgi:hypothetical protein
MPAPEDTKYIRVQDSDVANSVALVNSTIAGSPGTYASAGCFRGDLTISDTKQEIAVTTSNWCTAADAVLNQYRSGNRDVEFSGELTMLLADVGTEKMATAYESNSGQGEDLYWKTVFTDNEASPGSKTYEYRGFLKEWTKVAQENDVAVYRFAYRVTEILQDGA